MDLVPGWYPDPWPTGGWRWWDGRRWPYQDTERLVPPGDVAQRQMGWWWTTYPVSSVFSMGTSVVFLLSDSPALRTGAIAAGAALTVGVVVLERRIVAEVLASHRRLLAAPVHSRRPS